MPFHLLFKGLFTFFFIIVPFRFKLNKTVILKFESGKPDPFICYPAFVLLLLIQVVCLYFIFSDSYQSLLHES